MDVVILKCSYCAKILELCGSYEQMNVQQWIQIKSTEKGALGVSGNDSKA